MPRSLSTSQIPSPMKNPMTQVYKNETRLGLRRFWVKEPRTGHSENGLVEICYLYHRARHNPPINVSCIDSLLVLKQNALVNASEYPAVALAHCSRRKATPVTVTLSKNKCKTSMPCGVSMWRIRWEGTTHSINVLTNPAPRRGRLLFRVEVTAFGRSRILIFLSRLGGRRSTIGIPPNSSEAPHLRSSIPHPKTDLTAKLKLHPEEWPHDPSIV